MTTIIERVARALYEERYGQSALPWSQQSEIHKAPHISDARAAIVAMREGLPDFGGDMLVEVLARECESAGTSDETWAKLKALAEWTDMINAVLDGKPSS